MQEKKIDQIHNTPGLEEQIWLQTTIQLFNCQWGDKITSQRSIDFFFFFNCAAVCLFHLKIQYWALLTHPFKTLMFSVTVRQELWGWWFKDTSQTLHISKLFWAIMLPLLPFWMPWEGVADVQTTLRVHLYCPSMPDLWEKTGEHLLKQFSTMLINLHVWTYVHILSLPYIFQCFHTFPCVFLVLFILAEHAHSIIWFIGRKSNFCRCGTHYKSLEQLAATKILCGTKLNLNTASQNKLAKYALVKKK